MQNIEYDRGGSRFPGGKLKDFFSWLRGFLSPKYIPRRIRYGDSDREEIVLKSDSGSRSLDERSGQNN